MKSKIEKLGLDKLNLESPIEVKVNLFNSIMTSSIIYNLSFVKLWQ